MLQTLLNYFSALQATVCLLWRFRRVLWQGKAYFENAEVNGPQFRQQLIDSGPFYVKMGQWLSQRPDLLPRAFLRHLKSLQYDAPTHEFAHTLASLKAAYASSPKPFSASFEDVFVRIEREPLASGSIAQVHRATIRRPRSCSSAASSFSFVDAIDTRKKEEQREAEKEVENEFELLECVCKVRHPRVKEFLERDLRFIGTLFALGRHMGVQFCRVVDLESIIDEMRSQCSLRSELAPMLEFGENFARSPNVRFPQPMTWCQSDEAIVETLLHGVRYEQLDVCNDRTSVRDLCKRMTMAAFLHMVFLDGLVHGDCHGGNVLYNVTPKERERVVAPQPQGPVSSEENGVMIASVSSSSSSCSTVDPLPTASTAAAAEDRGEKDEDIYQGALAHEAFDVAAQVAFVDFGVTARVTQSQRHAFIELLSGGLSKDVLRCVEMVRHLVIDSNGSPTLSAEQEAGLASFQNDFKIVLEALDKDNQSSVGRMMNELLSLLQRHELRIDGNLVRIIVNFILIEEDYGYAKFNNVFDNTMRYVLYNDEHRDFDDLFEPFSDFFANHYAVRHGSTAPPKRLLVGTDETCQTLAQVSGARRDDATKPTRRITKKEFSK